jgi:hypothetical protein
MIRSESIYRNMTISELELFLHRKMSKLIRDEYCASMFQTSKNIVVCSAVGFGSVGTAVPSSGCFRLEKHISQTARLHVFLVLKKVHM